MQTQEEIDSYWEKLGAGGRYDHCGWLDDKFGFSWQIVPSGYERVGLPGNFLPEKFF
ncbi:VOC family protein [Pedobacter sp. AK017]|uniref:VOC family protein n=1 Tax=Pedobacter sp. AK017 TaxID=2723073 RepID=UPI003982F705